MQGLWGGKGKVSARWKDETGPCARDTHRGGQRRVSAQKEFAFLLHRKWEAIKAFQREGDTVWVLL